MEQWFKLSIEDRKIILNQVSRKTGLIPVAVEKDLWIMIVLRAIFSTEIANYLVFKKDYLAMKESMFYGETESFDNLIEKLRKLNNRINKIK